MNTTIRAGWLAFAFLCAAIPVSAQKSTATELLNRADRQFDLYSYNLAIQTYEQVLKEEKSNARALARIGDCHYQLNRPERAIEWYQKAQNTYNMEPDVPLRLGKALMQTGDYDAAKDQFLLYAQTEENIGRNFARMADYAIKNAKKEAQWQVKNEAINTAQADFGPAFYQTRVVFNSARTDMSPKNAGTADAPGGNNYLYVSQRNPESNLLQKPSFLRSDVQNNRNEGPVSFSANGRKVAFTRNRFISGTRQIAETGMNMSIYIADVEDGNWKNIKAFPYNGSNYATGFPCLSPDGSKLIFASTQPGGFGGWDIYVSNWTANGWSEPRNLGSPLNTPGNEVTPFFDGQDLYFSSDWHPGFGGLDVFRAALGSAEVTEVFHLGPGVNSPRDDYGFIYNFNENIGYLTSTRSGGRGNEDIWMVSKKWDDRDLATRGSTDNLRPTEYSTPADLDAAPARSEGPARRHVLVLDARGLPLTDVDIDLTDCYGSKGYTGGDGKFFFDELLRPIDCNVTVKKRGYRDATIALRDFGAQNVKITLRNDIREEFRGYVFDSKTQAPIRGVAVQVQLNEGTLEASTDEAGFYSLLLEPGLTYLVSYNKYGYTDAAVRTIFGYNTNNRITNVYLDKTNDPTITTTTAKRDDGYITYDNAARPLEYSTANEPTTRTVYPRETVKAPPVEKFNGYSIQLAAMPEEPSEARLQTYEPLTSLANLYVKKEGRMNKIRLGIFRTQAEADEKLKTVLKEKAYKGAWVVEERGADETLIIGNENLTPAQHSSTLPQGIKGSAAPVRYSLQLGSFASGKSFSISDYTRLSGIGNLYSKSEYGYTKVRMGVWANYEEAERAKAEAINKGFIDAIIITERADDPEIRDYLLSNGATTAPKGENPSPVLESPTPVAYSATPSAANPFYVRIAALTKPESFDASPMTGMGTIEKRKAENAPGMTVILLGSYPTQEAASKVATKLVGMGYSDAHVVKDSKGKLIRQ